MRDARSGDENGAHAKTTRAFDVVGEAVSDHDGIDLNAIAGAEITIAGSLKKLARGRSA